MINSKIPFFESFYEYGDLCIERVFFEYDGMPVLFASLDRNINRYFCLCTDSTDMMAWLVSRISKTDLIELLSKKKSVCEFFANSGEVILAEYNGEYRFKAYKGNEIPDSEMPEKNLYVEAAGVNEYLKRLESKRKVFIPMSVLGVNSVCGFMTRVSKTGYICKNTKFKRIKKSQRIMTVKNRYRTGGARNVDRIA